jgi:hypothetical protein
MALIFVAGHGENQQPVDAANGDRSAVTHFITALPLVTWSSKVRV